MGRSRDFLFPKPFLSYSMKLVSMILSSFAFVTSGQDVFLAHPASSNEEAPLHDCDQYCSVSDACDRYARIPDGESCVEAGYGAGCYTKSCPDGGVICCE